MHLLILTLNMVNVVIPQKMFQKSALVHCMKPKFGLILISKCKYNIECIQIYS